MRMSRWGIVVLAVTLSGAAQALTPDGLKAMLASEDPVTVIDLRSQAAYEAGTLPNAMRMSVREALEKPLRGRVVFFDDGTGPDVARRAAAYFAARGAGAAQGFALRGGYAAWVAARGQTTAAAGLRPVAMRYVSFQDLTGPMIADAADIVLLDVRPERSGMQPQAETGADPVDLAEAFPAFRMTRSLPRGPAAEQVGQNGIRPASADSPTPLYVLIDAGDGQAEVTARKLLAAGVHRFAILAGGEAIVRRRGEPGSVRRGPGAGLDADHAPRLPLFATVVEEEVTP